MSTFRRFLRSIGEYFRALVNSIQHLRTGGKNTRVRAQRRATRAGTCSACKRPLDREEDWRDHLEEVHPEWTGEEPADTTPAKDSD